jgi:hypothetical protein
VTFVATQLPFLPFFSDRELTRIIFQLRCSPFAQIRAIRDPTKSVSGKFSLIANQRELTRIIFQLRCSRFAQIRAIRDP